MELACPWPTLHRGQSLNQQLQPGKTPPRTDSDLGSSLIGARSPSIDYSTASVGIRMDPTAYKSQWQLKLD